MSDRERPTKHALRHAMLCLSALCLAFAPAPLPRRVKPMPWPAGLWVSEQQHRSTLLLRPDGTARETWMSSPPVEGVWRIDRQDGSVLCFSDRGGWMGVWYPVADRTLHAGYTGGVCYRLAR